MTQPIDRTIIVVGDSTIATLLAFALAPFEYTVQHTGSIAALMEGRRDGSLSRNPSGVVLTDLTGATHKELLHGIGTLLLSRIPVALIAYDPATVTFLEGAYPTLEDKVIKTHGEWLARQEENGQPITDADRENPLHSTYLTIAPAEGGARLLLTEFGPNLRHPITGDALTHLGPQYELPFPRPAAAGFAAADATTGRRGRILSVVSDKGGCGKSSVALMLASSLAYHTYLAGQPKSVVVVDLDRQSQLASQFPSATRSITTLRATSLPSEVMDACHEVPQVGNLYLMLGSRRSGDHLALRTVDLYAHVITTLASMFDVVIVDGSVGTTSDPVTSWVQQHSDGVYYVLDPSTESLTLAAEARDNSILAVDRGGLGLDPDKFRIIQNRVIAEQPAAQRAEWDRAVATRLAGTTVEAVLPDSHPEVTLAKAFEGGVVELVQTSDVLREPLRQLATRIFPDVLTADPHATERKKRFWER